MKLDLVYDAGDLGRGGMTTLAVNGSVVAEGHIDKTRPMIFSAHQTADVGSATRAPVAECIGIGPDETRFTGRIHRIALAVKDAA